MQIDRKLGMLLLSIWLIATGAVQLIGLHFQYDHFVLGGLAVAAGVVLILRR